MGEQTLAEESGIYNWTFGHYQQGGSDLGLAPSFGRDAAVGTYRSGRQFISDLNSNDPDVQSKALATFGVGAILGGLTPSRTLSNIDVNFTPPPGTMLSGPYIDFSFNRRGQGLLFDDEPKIRAWQLYEQRVNGVYADVPTASTRFRGPHTGKLRSAERMPIIDGVATPVEAKHTKSWASSPYNPRSAYSLGIGRNQSRAARRRMLAQAFDYSKSFPRVIYHSNDSALIKHWSRVFTHFKLDNMEFVHQP